MKGVMGTILRLWRFIWHARIGHMKTIQIRAVIFQDASLWCAQCLEHDIAVQANSVDKLIHELGSMLASYVELALIEKRDPFAGIPAAPAQFFEMFERAHEFEAPKLIEIDDAPAIAPEIRVLQAA
jgi:hypothetical protein